MLFGITIVEEILSVIICIHCIYGKKMKPDRLTLGLILCLLAILEYINKYQIENISTIMIYALLFLYCMWEFKGSVVKTIVNILLFMIVLTVIQFISILTAGVFVSGREEIQTVICNTIVLLTSIWLLPKFRLDKLSQAILRRKKLTILLLMFMFLVISAMLLQAKLLKKVYIEVFVFAIPAIVFLLILLMKWNVIQTKAERLEEELKITESSKKNIINCW